LFLLFLLLAQVPVANHVDVEISQAGPPAITHTWTNFKFSDFSDW
jgi:hypothetical protein